LRDFGLQVDFKIFYDELSGLISQSLDHDPELPLLSENRIHQSGFEGQVKWDVNSDNQLVLSFSRLKIEDDFFGNNENVDRENSLTAERSGSLSWINHLSKNTTIGAVYYHVDDWNIPRRPETNGFEFRRVDVTATHDIKLHDGYSLVLKGTLQYRLDDDALLYQANNYDDKEHYYLSAQLNF
jgi:iron complex outermembrane receptor protein